MHFHALPRHHSYLIYAFEKPPSTSSTGAFQVPHITGILFTNISYFLKTKRCSCAMRRKLYFTLFVLQKPVTRQLCWVFTMSSFSVTSDSRIIISSEARNLCYSRPATHAFPTCAANFSTFLICLSCRLYPIRPYGVPSPRGEGYSYQAAKPPPQP